MPGTAATPEQLADAIRRCLAAAVADGDLAPDEVPPEVGVRASAGSARGDFTSPVALQLSGRGVDVHGRAEGLAARLRRVPDVAAVEVAGAGHLNVTVHLAALVRAAQAAVPPAWATAPVPAPSPLTGPWEALAERVGPDVARWVRAQQPDGDPEALDRDRLVTRTVDNAAFRVLFAHARAVSALEWAGARGVDWRHQQLDGPDLAGPPGRPLLVAVATCAGGPEGGAGGPQGLARRLEALATAYLAFDATGPALPLGCGTVGPGHIARIWLAAATRSQLAAGLAWLGVVAPERI